ncbi:o-succinylbenzoate--CoA ligase [Microaerobacter geothermalis]|uniref:o-succinylbenzoate--CoA ligase n=1 Tax=Microaerobacter geothermalis TaxID=674972 RepID=UPI001F41FC6B|nr:o-succinylbenzoate--CoA ligase [Microaerobacter geothermalis]MCF6092811.1 o-succinylbenzoate--CoA ligase [Microaerobacter geothermalis]
MNGIVYWIDKRGEITPERTALIGEDRSLNYYQMSKEINRVARMLTEVYQLQKGDRVAILAMNGIEYLILLFALAKIECIAVPLNIRLSARELEFQMKDSGTKLLITESEFTSVVGQLQDLMEIKEIAWLDSSGPSLSLFDQAAKYSTDPFRVESVDGSSPYLICYTSGTTGRPKGAVLTQENMFWNALNCNLAIDITSEDHILTLLPLFHIGGIGLFAFPALLAGGTVIVPRKFNPEQALSMIEEQRVTIVMGVPAIHDALRKSPKFAVTDFSSIRWLYSGGAPCAHELISFFLDRGIPFGQGFGMTETSPTVFMLSKEDYQRKIGSIGKPALFCDIRIVDESGHDAKPGQAGELLVKGPNVMKEYWNLPDETAKTIKDGWLHTGDLARKDDEGFVYIAGRMKEMIISGGENIYPLEVEQVLNEIPAVDEVAVIGVPDEKWGEVPKAFVALKPGARLDEEDLKNHCFSRLARYKVPKSILFLDQLPKNATGKIDKPLLKREYGNE